MSEFAAPRSPQPPVRVRSGKPLSVRLMQALRVLDGLPMDPAVADAQAACAGAAARLARLEDALASLLAEEPGARDRAAALLELR